ncbi:uncharacterized protein LOC103180142 [Callorhinchus milii]|uniref:uncharacterized protein LOC103180142 n=1 Tax=Callorhinchus milii TaxID=7868 RepID=UPI00045729A1|nr:uncharacterized protein LOC103180142 [Callorhinchus milii]|eukprot:gi/632956529/ref/XP_007894001.1/ PREDICTED: uncharacterized protein LOC103180142 [Callorhinchus milii]
MLRGLLLSASPKSTFGWCDTEIGWSLQHRLNLTLPLRIMTLPLTQVIYEEKVGLQFEGSVEKESLERVRLQGIFLVFFLGDKEKDWLRTEGSQFRLTVSKGRWFKYMPVCVAGDSKYLVVELPAKARRWLHARSFQLSVRITPLIAQETNGMLASGQTMTIREAGDCPESLLKKLLFGWDEKQYTRVPPVIFGLLEGGRNTKASGCAAREFREADNEGSLKTKEEKIRKNAKLGKRD